jgi:hypothetical protein
MHAIRPPLPEEHVILEPETQAASNFGRGASNFVGRASSILAHRGRSAAFERTHTPSTDGFGRHESNSAFALDVLKERAYLWTVNIPVAEIVFIRGGHLGRFSPPVSRVDHAQGCSILRFRGASESGALCIRRENCDHLALQNTEFDFDRGFARGECSLFIDRGPVWGS